MDDFKPNGVPSGTVYAIREAVETFDQLEGICSSLGYRLTPIASAEEVLSGGSADRPGCLVIDYRVPESNGPAVRSRADSDRNPLPIVVTAHRSDLPTAVRLMNHCGVELLEKPYQTAHLRDAIQRAVRQDETNGRVHRRFEKISASVDRLSTRETEVLQSIVAGQLNKSIAKNLNVSVRTVEGDRARIVEKFGAETTGEVVGKYAEYRLLSELGYRTGPVPVPTT